MKITRCAIAAAGAFAFGLLLMGCAKGDPKAQAQKDLQKIYDEQGAAMGKKDVEGSLTHYATDYVAVGTTGRTHDLAGERKEMMTAFAAPISQMQFTTTIHDVTMEGGSENQATVTTVRHATGQVTNAQAGLSVPVVLDAEMRDFWVKGSGGWQLKREKLLSMKTMVNGKPMPTH